MNKQHYELNRIHENYTDDVEEEIDLSHIEHEKHHRNHARRSVDDYLESKRIRDQYRSLFDDEFKDL